MQKLSIREIELRLSMIQDDSDPFLVNLEKDERIGVMQAVSKWRKQQEQAKKINDKYKEMTEFERKYHNQGFSFIAGIDEVGRGPLAGPVVAAAVILPKDFFLGGINDSKKLTEKKREEYDIMIRENALSYNISMIDAVEIDRINIYEATKKAMLASIAGLHQKPDFLLIDAMKLSSPFPSESIIKGDARSVSIAAASIIAKVARDQYMRELSQQFPEYGFDRHMGYGTKEHLMAIETYGITPYHRKSFSPIKEIAEPNLFTI